MNLGNSHSFWVFHKIKQSQFLLGDLYKYQNYVAYIQLSQQTSLYKVQKASKTNSEVLIALAHNSCDVCRVCPADEGWRKWTHNRKKNKTKQKKTNNQREIQTPLNNTSFCNEAEISVCLPFSISFLKKLELFIVSILYWTNFSFLMCFKNMKKRLFA